MLLTCPCPRAKDIRPRQLSPREPLPQPWEYSSTPRPEELQLALGLSLPILQESMELGEGSPPPCAHTRPGGAGD